MGDVEANTMKTLLEILNKSSLLEAKNQALEVLLGLTGSPKGLKTIYEYGNTILVSLFKCLFDDNLDLAQKSCSILINISAEKQGAELLLSARIPDLNVTQICKPDFRCCVFSSLLEIAMNRNNAVSDSSCIILSNLSRSSDSARRIYESWENPDTTLSALISRIVKTDVKADHLASFLSNLSQLKEVRTFFLNSSDDSMYKLLTLIDFKDSAVKRKAAIGIIRNLSFYDENHEKLLDSENDLIARILLPLAGPEEFDDEDNEKLPLDLQFLPADKKRESNRELRKMLVEIFMQLAATSLGRKTMRDNNVYVIFREYHKWETDNECLQLIEDFVNILIRTEDEIGVDNLRDNIGIDREDEDDSSTYIFM